MDFLPTLPVLIAYSGAVVVFTLTPGPDMALYLGNTLSGGWRRGLASFFGTAAGLVVHASLAAAGISALLAASASIFLVLKIAGALYLCYLAFDILRHGSALNLSDVGRADGGLGLVFLKGLGINILNPKIILFFVTFLPQFIEPGDPSAAAKLFFLGNWYIVVTLPITLCLIGLAARIAHLATSRPRIMRGFDYAFAGVMAVFALRLLAVHAARP